GKSWYLNDPLVIHLTYLGSTKELLFTPDPEKIIRENRNARNLALQQSQQTHKPWDPRPMGDDQMKGNVLGNRFINTFINAAEF
ncbi:hypothetical protein L195_g055934, partial [Trifolium pratense]